MKISIAVPSYNYGVYLTDCLNSILNQNYSNYEVLICDGGSQDDSLHIIQNFCTKDERFKLVSQKDIGQSDAIIKAFLQSDGDILCFLNADDMFITNTVFSEVVSSFLNFNRIDIVSFGGYYINSNGINIKKINLRYHPFDDFTQMKYRTAVIQPSTFWKRHVYINTPFKIGFEFSFDSVFFYECFLKYNWLELTLPVSGYRWHNSNKSSTISSKRVGELMNFEKIKFGNYSFRVFYLKLIKYIFYIVEQIYFIPNKFKNVLRILVNGISYLTFYRLPSI